MKVEIIFILVGMAKVFFIIVPAVYLVGFTSMIVVNMLGVDVPETAADWALSILAVGIAIHADKWIWGHRKAVERHFGGKTK